MTDDAPYLVELGEAQTAVARALFDALPREGWEKCTVEYRKPGPVAESKVHLTEIGGETVTVKSPPPMVVASSVCESSWLVRVEVPGFLQP